MQIETADVSLIGHREENQDRVAVAAADNAVLLVVIDGMGGHAEGARAAETALATLLEAFWQTPHPIFDPLGFLHLTLGRAHEEVAKLGASLPLEMRPRATCAVCLVQGGSAFWAHIGDSRVYLLRRGKVFKRTRFILHKNPWNLTNLEGEKLAQLQRTNKPIYRSLPAEGRPRRS